MMNLSDVRRELATAMFGERDDTLRERLKATYPLMKEEAPPGRGFRQGAPAPGSPENVAILVLTAMLGGAPQTAYRRVKRIWEARFEGPETDDPATGGRQFGWALKTLLSNATVRGRLNHLSILPSVSVASLVWTNLSFSLFHPYTGVEWERVQQEIARGDHAVELKLPVRSFHRIAALLAESASP
jgi:hypothetical protein